MLSNRIIGIIVKQAADRRLLRQFLSEMGLSCIEATVFSDVDVSDVRWREVGLLLVDEYNSDRFGEEILGLKIREVAAYLPILALSSHATSPAHFLEKGFDDVLRIPITMSEFKARILAFLRLREASEQRFQTLFESTPIGIFRVAPTGRLLIANPALLRMLDFNSLDEAREASMKRPDLTPVRSAGSYVGEAVWRSATGASIPVLVRSSATRDEAGRPLYVEGTVEDLTDRKAIETALRDHAARLTLALDAASMGDIDLNFETGMIECAHMVYRLFGFDSEPVDRSYEHLGERILPGDRRTIRRAINEAIRTGETLDEEFRIRWPDGSDRWLRARGEVMYDDRQQPERLVGVIRDATDEKRVQIDLIRAKVEAEQLAALKSTFLANMSHEIRTPLTAIIGFASLLAGRVADDQRGAVTRIQEGGQRLLETLNAILTLARLESRQMDLVMEDVDVVKEARGTLDMFETQARDKGLTLSFEPAVASARARLDRGALNSVLQNLYSNAIKFTDAGGVTVRVELQEAARNRPMIWVSVTDTGSGIDEEFIPQVFEEFQQESSGIRRVYEGAGLGLAIVRRLTDLLGGEITVESTKGVGSTFRAGFPAQSPARRQSAKKDESEVDAKADDTPRLLIVEDNEDTRLLLTELLADRFEVSVASDGDEALELATVSDFDMILMDINLGQGITGVDVVERLRSNGAYATTPIIALTAYALPGDRERFLERGFTAHLPKPFNPESLLRLLRKLNL